MNMYKVPQWGAYRVRVKIPKLRYFRVDRGGGKQICVWGGYETALR